MSDTKNILISDDITPPLTVDTEVITSVETPVETLVETLVVSEVPVSVTQIPVIKTEPEPKDLPVTISSEDQTQIWKLINPNPSFFDNPLLIKFVTKLSRERRFKPSTLSPSVASLSTLSPSVASLSTLSPSVASPSRSSVYKVIVSRFMVNSSNTWNPIYIRWFYKYCGETVPTDIEAIILKYETQLGNVETVEPETKVELEPKVEPKVTEKGEVTKESEPKDLPVTISEEDQKLIWNIIYKSRGHYNVLMNKFAHFTDSTRNIFDLFYERFSVNFYAWNPIYIRWFYRFCDEQIPSDIETILLKYETDAKTETEAEAKPEIKGEAETKVETKVTEKESVIITKESEPKDLPVTIAEVDQKYIWQIMSEGDKIYRSVLFNIFQKSMNLKTAFYTLLSERFSVNSYAWNPIYIRWFYRFCDQQIPRRIESILRDYELEEESTETSKTVKSPVKQKENVKNVYESQLLLIVLEDETKDLPTIISIEDQKSIWKKMSMNDTYSDNVLFQNFAKLLGIDKKTLSVMFFYNLQRRFGVGKYAWNPDYIRWFYRVCGQDIPSKIEAILKKYEPKVESQKESVETKITESKVPAKVTTDATADATETVTEIEVPGTNEPEPPKEQSTRILLISSKDQEKIWSIICNGKEKKYDIDKSLLIEVPMFKRFYLLRQKDITTTGNLYSYLYVRFGTGNYGWSPEYLKWFYAFTNTEMPQEITDIISNYTTKKLLNQTEIMKIYASESLERHNRKYRDFKDKCHKIVDLINESKEKGVKCCIIEINDWNIKMQPFLLSLNITPLEIHTNDENGEDITSHVMFKW